jgi:hypothetical protein
MQKEEEEEKVEKKGNDLNRREREDEKTNLKRFPEMAIGEGTPDQNLQGLKCLMWVCTWV